ncbi:MAG: hypothetical protein HND57_14145 [Planctomycetes bacterium]|nr:hypothetical protein [Planctomycetota bacterium]
MGSLTIPDGPPGAPHDLRCLVLVSRGLAFSRLEPPQSDKAIADFKAVINMSDARHNIKAYALMALMLEESDPESV